MALIKTTTLALILTFTTLSVVAKSSTNKQKECKYYTYVVYGDAMANGQLKVKEPVYRGFKIKKSTDNFFACFDHYRSTKAGDFKVINIGPYDTEAVIYQEINRVRENLEAQGYNEAAKYRHTVTGVMLYGNTPCE